MPGSTSERTSSRRSTSSRLGLGGAEAAVGQELGEPLAGQPAQRLADRRAGDPELLGELDLAEPGAGRDLALESIIARIRS